MLKIEYVKAGELKPYANNAKLHPAEQIEQIKKSIEEFGMNDPIAIWKDNEVIEGHGRLQAILEIGGVDYDVPIIRLDSLTDEQRRAYMLVHNKLTMNSGFDIDLLNMELDDITDINMADFGFDVAKEVQGFEPIAEGSLQERYLVPPFSVLYGNRGDWLDRKRQWIRFGIRSELGRGGETCVSVSRMDGETVIVDEGCINGDDVQNRGND